MIFLNSSDDYVPYINSLDQTRRKMKVKLKKSTQKEIPISLRIFVTRMS